MHTLLFAGRGRGAPFAVTSSGRGLASARVPPGAEQHSRAAGGGGEERTPPSRLARNGASFPAHLQATNR